MGRILQNVLIASLLIAALFCHGSFSNDCHAATLRVLEVVSAERSSDVILRVDGEVNYQQDYLPANGLIPARCYIDLYGTRNNHVVPTKLLVDDQRIQKIRTGDYATKTRVVLDLKNEFSCSVVRLKSDSLRIRVSSSSADSLKADKGFYPQAELTSAVTAPEIANTGVKELQVVSSNSIDDALDAEQTDIHTSPFAAEGGDTFSVWGWLQFYSAHDIKDERAEDHKFQRLTGRLGSDWEKELNAGHLVELHAAIEVDRIFYDSELADEDTNITLRETYLQYNSSDWDVSFGKQRVRWGKSDQLSPVDSLNPQDFRQFITVDLEERALPSWMLRNRWHGDSVGLETIVQPWFQESELEYFDSDWALYRNLRQSIIDDPGTPSELKEYVRNIRVNEQKPNDTLENISAATRVTWTTEQSDFALSYHYGWETMPTINSFPVKNINDSDGISFDPTQPLIFTDEQVISKYKRQQTAGFEWETVLDPIGFRGEVAHIDHVAFLSNDFASKSKPVTHLVSGIDYISATEWYFNVQGSWLHIHDYAKDILFFEQDTVSVLGEISKPVWRGNLELALQYNYTITDQSTYLRPYATLKYFRNLECEVGANVFSGDSDTLFGSYDQADQVYARIKYSF